MARGQLTQVIYDTHRDDDDDRYELIISCGSIFALPLSLEVSKIFRNRLLSRPLHRLSFVDESRNQHTTQGKKSPPKKSSTQRKVSELRPKRPKSATRILFKVPTTTTMKTLERAETLLIEATTKPAVLVFTSTKSPQSLEASQKGEISQRHSTAAATPTNDWTKERIAEN